MSDKYSNKSDYSRFKPIGYPVRHKRKIPFEPTLSLDLRYREIIRKIRQLDSILDSFVLGSSDYLELIKDAYSDNIHWSTKIEGNRLTLEEVKDMATRFTEGNVIENNTGPYQEIMNHLYSFFMKRELTLPWEISTLMSTHYILMNGVNEDVVPGLLRNVEVSVKGSDGTEYFITAPFKNIIEETESLLEWLNNSPYDELVTATIFFHEFESIHPFKDGNGRTGRTLFQVLLQELGLKNCKLCKFEQEMLSDSQTYYDLMAFTDATGSYSQLVMYVAESLLNAYEKAVEVFQSKDRLKDMDENTRTIVKKSKTVERFTFNDALQWIPGMGMKTLRTDLDNLVEMDILKKTGKTKGMVYSFNDPLKDLRMNNKMVDDSRNDLN